MARKSVQGQRLGVDQQSTPSPTKVHTLSTSRQDNGAALVLRNSPPMVPLSGRVGSCRVAVGDWSGDIPRRLAHASPVRKRKAASLFLAGLLWRR